MRAERPRWLVPALACAWLVGLSLGARAIYAFSTNHGETGATPERWPDASRLAEARDGTTTVMFVHPDCPCSRASLQELSVAMREVPAHGRVTIVFEGEGGELWARAGTIPGIDRTVDDGADATRFGALTSGYVVVYDARGALAFHGGVTGSRGHVGDNVGRTMLESVWRGTTTGDHLTFGCALTMGAP